MNEILGVIFYTYMQQELGRETRQIEADLYWVLKFIMDEGNHKEMFNYSAKTKIDNTSIIRHIKGTIFEALECVDYDLYKLFVENNFSAEIFLTRWIKVGGCE